MDTNYVKNSRDKIWWSENVWEDQNLSRDHQEEIIRWGNSRSFEIDLQCEWITLDKAKVIKKIFNSLRDNQRTKIIFPNNPKESTW